jgi:hypothetical protein
MSDERLGVHVGDGFEEVGALEVPITLARLVGFGGKSIPTHTARLRRHRLHMESKVVAAGRGLTEPRNSPFLFLSSHSSRDLLRRTETPRNRASGGEPQRSAPTHPVRRSPLRFPCAAGVALRPIARVSRSNRHCASVGAQCNDAGALGKQPGTRVFARARRNWATRSLSPALVWSVLSTIDAGTTRKAATPSRCGHERRDQLRNPSRSMLTFDRVR